MPEADKEAIKGVVGDNTVGLYLDVTLFKKVGNGAPKKVTDVNGKVKISVIIPENLRKEGRTFEVVRVHDGKPTVIQGTYDDKAYTFTFETEQFSSYAIAYKDSEPDNNETNVSETNVSDDNKIITTSPKTGDSYDLSICYLLLIASFGEMLILVCSMKKEDSSK